MKIQFQYPIVLITAVIVGLLMLLFFYWAEKRAHKKMQRFASHKLLHSLIEGYHPVRQWIKHSLITFSVVFLLIALARPQWGYIETEKETESADVLIALDTSRSMLAEDLRPNRLERAKLAILDLVRQLEGDRVGLIAFAGESFLQCPLTLDYAAFRETLNAIDTNSIPTGGTDLADAINEAMNYFQIEGANKNLVLITDGEDLEGRGQRAAEKAVAQGIRIFTVGVGDPDGDLIPITLPNGSRDYVRDESGVPVKSTLNESSLRQIAQTAQGSYQNLSTNNQALLNLYESIMNESDRLQVSEMTRVPIERFSIPLLLGVLFLLLESLISNRRMNSKQMSIVCLSLLGLMGISPSTAEAGLIRDAKKAYQNSDYESAIEYYESWLKNEPESDNWKVFYNLGNAYYRTGNYTKAAENFRKSLRSDVLRVQESSFYNLANALIQKGEEVLETDSSMTQNLWQEALIQLENCLALNAESNDARRNQNLLNDRIAALTFNASLSASPLEAGTVDPSQISSFYKIPQTIKATPNEGWRFEHWTGITEEPIEDAETKITLTENIEILAHFIKTWNLSVRSEDESAGTAGTSGTYDEATDITITAEPKDYFAFKEWKSDSATIADPKAAETTLQIFQDSEVTATFVPAFKLDVTIEPKEGGQAGQSGFYEEYSVVPIQAKPRDGFVWESWEGDGIEDSTTLETTVALTGDKAVVAKVKRIWNLVLIPVPEEAGSVTGGGDYPIGTTVDISTEANEGFTFSHWEGPAISNSQSAQTQTTVQSQEQTLYAIYEQDDSNNQDQQNDQNQDQQNQDQDQQNQDQNQNQDSQENESNSENEPQESESQDNQSPEENENQNPESNEEQPNESEPNEPQESDSESDQNENTPEDQGSEESPAPMPTLPGQLSQEEANQLLQSLDDSQNILPAVREGQRSKNTEPSRNW